MTLFRSLLAWCAGWAQGVGAVVSFLVVVGLTPLVAAVTQYPMTATLVIAALVVLLARWFVDSVVGRKIASSYLALIRRWSGQPKLSSIAARSIFQSTPTVSMRPSTNHTHPSSAAERTSAAALLAAVAQEMGYTPYYVQMSESDVRAGRGGCRSWHWGKDVNVPPEEFAPPPNAAICMVDVDMYIDMPLLLASNPAQYLITTFQPSEVACDTGEYSFTFDQNDECLYRVSGGATYKHPVWNYAGDVIVAETSSWFWSTTVVYAVDKRQTGPHHQVISLSPMARFSAPVYVPSLSGAVLKRLKVACGQYLRMDVATKAGLMRSTGRAGAYNSSTLPASVDDALAVIARLSPVHLSLAQVRQTTGITDDAKAAALADYHRSKVPTKPDTVYPVEESINRYQFGRYEPDAPPSMVPFMSPVMLGCYAPDLTRGNEEQCIKGRVEDVASQQGLTPFVNRCMDEFVVFLIPVPHQLSPMDIPDVHEHQPRPSQRSILERAGMTTKRVDDAPYVEAMQKKEAYAKPTDPRNITIIPGVTKMTYSRYLYAYSQVIKRQRWCGSARSPAAIASRVAEICAHAKKHAVKGDFQRMDGHISPALRSLERRAALRAFDEQFHEEFLEAAHKQYNRKGKTKHGVRYDLGTSRASGSSETTDFNTEDTAFVVYLAFRYMGLEPQQAWDALGIYCGDDGLTADVDCEALVAAARAVGQEVDAIPVPRHAFGVQFLARCYSPFVWHGSPNSMCDIRRTLSKFHTTPRLPPGVTPLQKLREKCTGYALCDPNTPVLGQWCRTVLELFGSTETDFGIKPYAAYAGTLEDQYPNLDEGGWMGWQFIQSLPQFDCQQFYRWLVAVREGRADVLSPPLCCNESGVVAPKVPVVINGVNAAPKEPVAPPAPAASADPEPPPAPGRRRKNRRKRPE